MTFHQTKHLVDQINNESKLLEIAVFRIKKICITHGDEF